MGRLGDTILATPVIEVLRNYVGDQVTIDFVTSTGASARILSMDQCTFNRCMNGLKPEHVYENLQQLMDT